MKKLNPLVAQNLSSEIDRVKQGIAELDNLLRDTATPDQLKRWLMDICQASDIRFTKDGAQFMSPNWEARIKGFDRVMSILRYTQKDYVPQNQPTKIVIQVIDSKMKGATDAAIPAEEIK